MQKLKRLIFEPTPEEQHALSIILLGLLLIMTGLQMLWVGP
jgi:hypothetical protein